MEESGKLGEGEGRGEGEGEGGGGGGGEGRVASLGVVVMGICRASLVVVAEMGSGKEP